jgi:hypothetical protein
MYLYKTPRQIEIEKMQSNTLYFVLGAVLGFSLACLIIYINL